MTIALARKKTPLVMKALQLETEPYARANLQVMRRKCAVDDSVADIESHSYSFCRIEFEDTADIQRKIGVSDGK
jgi:hypothetical protein